jgi:hypothetical protein
MDDRCEPADADNIITQTRNSVFHPCGAQIQSQYFESSRHTLLSVFELSQEYNKVLQNGGSLARHFNVPLVSDILAERVVCLFSEVRPHVLEAEDDGSGSDITWIDVVRECPSNGEWRDGKYQIRLRNKHALIQITQFDYNLILSDIPRRLVHPRSHATDILAEMQALELMTIEMRLWNSVASNSESKMITIRPLLTLAISLRDNQRDPDPIVRKNPFRSRSGHSSTSGHI